MVAELSNPFSTGAGGSNFEVKVQASFVASMILGGPCPCLPPGGIETIRFQAKQAGYHTDDLLITVVTAATTRHRLLCQVKHGIAFTQSDEAFREFLLAAWRDFNNPERFDSQRDAIALATGPQSANIIDHVRPLLEWARHSDNTEEFFAKVKAPKFSSGPKQAFIDAVRRILSKADSPPAEDAAIWRFLRTLNLLAYDFDAQHGQNEALVMTMLTMAKASDCPESVAGLWAHILDMAHSLNHNAGTISRQSLDAVLTPVLQQAFGRPPAILIASSLERLKEHTELSLRRISDEFMPGVRLERKPIIDEAVDLLEQHQVLVVTGDAGDGKSVVAKRAIVRLADEGMPVFAFRMDEFDSPHLHQALAQMGVQDTIGELSARFAMLPRKILFVDSVERLFELQSRDAFIGLLDSAARDPGWRIILACRTQGSDLLVNHILLPTNLSVGTLKVPRLADSELQWVAELVPQIKPYLEDDRLIEILRIPFYLRIACNASPGLLVRQADRGASFDIRRLFWQDAVERPLDQQGGLPTRRANTFIEIAVRRAKSMHSYVAINDLDLDAVHRLESDGLLVRNEQGRCAPAQDLLEDWALLSYIDRCFHEANGNWNRFFLDVGAEPALRRTFRIWLTQAITSPEAVRIGDFVVDVSRDTAIPQHWRDEVLAGVLLSDAADNLVARIGPALLENGKALLVRAIHLLRTACKGPNDKFIKLLGKTGRRINPFLALTFTRPVGRGWEAIIRFTARNIDNFEIKEANVLLGLLSDWAGALDLGANLPPEATDCAQLALKYFLLLTEKDVYARDLDKQYLEILLKVPHAVPDEIKVLYAQLMSTTATVRPREIRARLLDEYAIKSFHCATLCRFFPDIVTTVLENRVLWNSSRDPDRYHLDVDEHFGLGRHFEFNFFPASAYQGPFIYLLTWHSEIAIPFLIRFVDRACEAYARSGLDGEIPRVPLRLGEGRERLVLSSIRLWCLYRGTQVGPNILESALMALEELLLGFVERGEDISPWSRFILENATSVAPLAVLASVALAHPSALGEDVLPLLGTLDFYARDLQRQLLDGRPVGDLRPSLGIPTGGAESIFYDERKRSDDRPHRKSNLEELAVRLQFGPLQSRVAGLIDVMKGDVGKKDQETQDSIHARLILKRIDLREYKAAEKTSEGVVMRPKVDEPALLAVVEESQKKHEHFLRVLRLHNWAMATFNGETSEAFPEWGAALAEAQEIARLSDSDVTETTKGSDEDMYDHRSLRILAYVAACLIRDHRHEMDKDAVAWCSRELREAVEEQADTVDMTTQVGRFQMHGSRPAAAVLPLLLDVCKSDEASVRGAIATALTHAVEEVRQWAITGARDCLWDRDPSFAELCCAGLLAFASLRWQALEASRHERGREPSFGERSLLLAQDLRATLTSGKGEVVVPASVSLNDVIDEDLLAALRLVPVGEKGAKYQKLFAVAMNDLVEEEVAHARDRKERVRYEFRYGFSALFAEFFLKQDNGAPELLASLMAAVDRAPEIATEVLKNLILSTEDKSPSDERFWAIWRRCAAAAFEDQVIRESERVFGYEERRRLLRTLLFAETAWKKDLKTWGPLERHRDFVAQAFERIGDTPAGFGALVRLLRTIGHFLLPDALKDLDDARSRCSSETMIIENENARYELELLLRDCVLLMGTQILSREVLRKATLNLLDHLVNEGSSLAFQLRELMVAPTLS